VALPSDFGRAEGGAHRRPRTAPIRLDRSRGRRGRFPPFAVAMQPLLSQVVPNISVVEVCGAFCIDDWPQVLSGSGGREIEAVGGT